MNDNVKPQPFKAMMSYISRVFFKKKSTYIWFTIFSIVILGISIFPALFIKFADIEYDVLIYYTICISCFIASVAISAGASGIHAALKTVHIFLDTQNDGFEIIIISKPITRKQIFLARLLFLFLFGLFISIIHLIFLTIGVLIVREYLTAKIISLILGGTFGTNILTFLIISAITLMIGLGVSVKAGRILPILILFISMSLQSMVFQIGSIFSKNPITKINESFESYVNNEIKKEGSQLNNLTFVDNRGKSRDLKYIDASNAFIVDENVIKFNNVRLRNYIPGENISSSEKVVYDLSSTSSQNTEYIDYSFEWLHNAVNKKIIHGADWLIAFSYINPMSSILDISGYSSLQSSMFNVEIGGLNVYSNYSNIAPKFVDNKYWKENELGEKYTTYNSTIMNPPWALALMWSSIIIALIGLSFVIYQRKDFK